MKVDIMAAISAIWSRRFGSFQQLNSAYITLLPKRDDAISIRDYRLISLVHSFAKLITKILANLLFKVLSLKLDLSRITLCWFSKRLDFSISKSKLGLC
jgi:hypothetical protein